ncbi:MAG: hypothetical protein QM610_14620 [Chitinophagaceae bacterium]
MAHTAQIETIDNQISNYVSHLSDKGKKAVLAAVQSIAEAETDAEFERKWAEGGLTLEELRQNLLTHVRSFEWKKK